MARPQRPEHPDEAALAAFAAGDEPTQTALRQAAPIELSPPRDLAGPAVRRLRGRQSSIDSVNEVFASLRALLRGLTDVLGGRS